MRSPRRLPRPPLRPVLLAVALASAALALAAGGAATVAGPPAPAGVVETAALSSGQKRCALLTARVRGLDRQIATARRLVARGSTVAIRRAAAARLGRLVATRTAVARARRGACRTTSIIPRPAVTRVTEPAPPAPAGGGTAVSPAPGPGPGTPPPTTDPAPPPPPEPPGPAIPPPGARAGADRPDQGSGSVFHIVYAVPRGAADRRLDTNGAIAASLAAGQEFLRGAGGFTLRIDEYGGVPDITFFRLSRTDDELAASGDQVPVLIQEELVAAGFDEPDKLLLVFYEGTNTTACGSAAWPPEVPGTVGGLYLHGEPPGYSCDAVPLAGPGETAGYWEHSLVHEALHLTGMAPSCAPNSDLRGHVTDSPADLMYSGPLPWEPTAIDADQDDYFRAGIPGCWDLSRSAYIND